MILNEYLWNIDIGHSPASLSMFNDLCQNVLKIVGSRVVSLRLTLTNVIDGSTLISSSLNCHRITLLQRLHLIDIEEDEFNKLIYNGFMKQIHTLLVDIDKWNSLNYLQVEGIYLTKVCSEMPLLRRCRLPFSHNYCSSRFSMILPNVLHTNHLRKLTLGNHTIVFLERLLLCIPLIENLSIGIEGSTVNFGDRLISLPSPVDISHVRYLSRLHLNCIGNSSFHESVALFSSIFGQVDHLSLKLNAYTFVSGPSILSGHVIKKCSIDRLKPCATYSLHLLFHVLNDFHEKKVFNDFFKVRFVNRNLPKVYIQEYNDCCSNRHCFLVHTSSFKEKILPINLLSTVAKNCDQMSVNANDLFPYANELLITGYKKSYFSEISNSQSSMSSKVPWKSLRKITIDECTFISAAHLESILRMTSNVDTLKILDNQEGFSRMILRNIDQLGTRINEQIKSISFNDSTLTLKNAPRFCQLLSKGFSQLRIISLTIFLSEFRWTWKPFGTIHTKSDLTKRIVSIIGQFIDSMKELVSLQIIFNYETTTRRVCFPDLIEKELYQYPPSRPYRMRSSPRFIQIWL